jgi:hypothetical protein
MPSSRLYHIAEEGKRSDDYVHRGRSPLTSSILFWRGGLSRFRRRRILSVVLVVLLLYFLWAPLSLSPQTQGALEVDSIKGGRGRSDETDGHYYDGPIRFRRLAHTIYGASWRWRRSNVLFAAASLQSASAMVPIACEMARYRRNVVHFILLGRYDISIEELLLKNGVGDGCDVHWHGLLILLERICIALGLTRRVQTADQAIQPRARSSVWKLAFSRPSALPAVS